VTPDGEVDVRPYQIIVWVSLASKRVEHLDPRTPRFPAVLDTGNNHNFSMKEEHLTKWSGENLAGLRRLSHVDIGAHTIPLVSANIWLHRTLPGERDQFAKGPPFRLELVGGVAVYPTSVPSVARIPTLGLRALVRAGLKLTIDGAACHVNLRT
jgi:hypothetical protein